MITSKEQYLYKIAGGFFRDNAVKLQVDFKKTDLYKYLESLYGELVYVNQPGFFISVCKHGKETWLMEKVFYDAPEHYKGNIFKGDIELVEVGCWIPLSMKKYINRKAVTFPLDHTQSFSLSKQGYCVVDVEDKEVTEKFFKKFLPDNTIFDRLDEIIFDDNKKSLDKPFHLMGNSSLVGMLIGKRKITIGNFTWEEKFEKDLVGRQLDENTLIERSLNTPHGEVEIEKGKALIFNIFNPRFYFKISKSTTKMLKIFGGYSS